MRLSEVVVLQARIPQFHTAVDERFAFLLNQGFRVADRTTYADRWGRVQFERENTQVDLSWDASAGGELVATLDGVNLWPLVVAEGLWDAGRDRGMYMGYAIEAMEHGLDRIASLLKAHPELLVAKIGSETPTTKPE
jgi:hypothetical protein